MGGRVTREKSTKFKSLDYIKLSYPYYWDSDPTL